MRTGMVAVALAMLAGCSTLSGIGDGLLGAEAEVRTGGPATAVPTYASLQSTGARQRSPRRATTRRGGAEPAVSANALKITPTQAIASAAPADWRAVDPNDLLLMDLRAANGQPARRVVIELAPSFAPVHVANIRAFARAGWWNRSGIYRVQDNYVAQWGNGETSKGMPTGVVPLPPAEYDRDLVGLTPRPLGFPDGYRPQVGHLSGWPVAWNPRRGRGNLIHCYGMVGVGRGEAPDTGSGGELYAVIGHAPRHLDRNIALVGRVIDGIDALSARPRGTEALGFYKLRSSDIPIAKVTLAADLPVYERPVYEVLDTSSAAFASYVTARANRRDSFFVTNAVGLDICNAPVPTRKR